MSEDTFDIGDLGEESNEEAKAPVAKKTVAKKTVTAATETKPVEGKAKETVTKPDYTVDELIDMLHEKSLDERQVIILHKYEKVRKKFKVDMNTDHPEVIKKLRMFLQEEIEGKLIAMK